MAQYSPLLLKNAGSLLMAGVSVIAVLATGEALADPARAERERLAASERHWASEVQRRRLSLELRNLDHQECQVDLLAKRTKEPIVAARRELLGRGSSNAAASAHGNECESIADAAKRDRERLTEAELKLEIAQEDNRIAAGLIPRHSPALASAWSAVSPSWLEITSNSKFRALDEHGKESVRLDYWSNYVSPRIPTDELRRARRQFDEITAPKR